mmetsp:Transcript_25642/g.46293  ORF Transcript_25642/g.46293 Transcript_25642/m.46293 type:complete len:82 (+) Transcript_25642:1568-1813(+)
MDAVGSRAQGLRLRSIHCYQTSNDISNPTAEVCASPLSSQEDATYSMAAIRIHQSQSVGVGHFLIQHQSHVPVSPSKSHQG